MIILDLNQIMVSNYMAQLGRHVDIPVEPAMFRHMVLNTIRTVRKKFNAEYGELVIACDDRNYWRKEAFPYYKANRKKDRDQSSVDWSALFNTLTVVRDELSEHFPYRLIQVETAEADDIIATLCMEFGNDSGLALGEKILIVSGDKDFIQLQAYSNVEQYDHVHKRWVRHNDPADYTIRHVITGDKGDGIPNIFSPGNTFVVGGRQKPARKKMVDGVVEAFNEFRLDEHLDEFQLTRFKCNDQLIRLTNVPEHIKAQALAQYKEQAGREERRRHLLTYFITNKLKTLTEAIGDF